MIRISEILDKIWDYNPDADLFLVEQAYVYSARVHDGQLRLSGEPYLSHPLEVAGILADMHLDVASVAAGLLHDVIEDTHATAEEIEDMFGDEVRHIVQGVTKLSELPYHSSEERQAENLRRMILAMADDIRVILIKLADRLHNMRTLQYQKPHKQVKISQETMDIYAAIAGRLGIYWIKKELEDASFRYLNPEEYENLTTLIARNQQSREEFIKTVKDLLTAKMDEAKLRCEVLGRHKHLYSIHQKMVHQDLPFEEIYDITAFRIILDTIPQCYEALGVIHSLWKPIPKKFKDYIGVPKPNMYQSLHTTVIGPTGDRIEIQIRTHEMDRVAKSGIAAHWRYKEGAEQFDRQISKRFAFIQNLVENQENFRNPNEFLENLRIDLFPDEVFVFTPNGEIKTLPEGATPVDFAYMIHSEVGDTCTGAKVNGRMVPLPYELKTGDIVEIITSKGHHPSKDWVNFVKTVKAKSKIRQWIKTQEKERSLSLGRELCDKAFKKYRLSFAAHLKSPEMEQVVKDMGFKTAEDLIASVGYGKVTPLQLVRKFMPRGESESEDEALVSKLLSGRPRKKRLKGGVIVKGLDDILIRFGKCCNPVPGDPITGYITRGQGVTVHRANCNNAMKMTPERQIDVQWNIETQETYPVKLRVRAMDRIGLLADLAASISKNDSNILSLNTEVRDSQMVTSLFTVLVGGREHLERVVADMRKIKHVQEVKRIA